MASGQREKVIESLLASMRREEDTVTWGSVGNAEVATAAAEALPTQEPEEIYQGGRVLFPNVSCSSTSSVCLQEDRLPLSCVAPDLRLPIPGSHSQLSSDSILTAAAVTNSDDLVLTAAASNSDGVCTAAALSELVTGADSFYVDSAFWPIARPLVLPNRVVITGQAQDGVARFNVRVPPDAAAPAPAPGPTHFHLHVPGLPPFSLP